ncbi:MAG TPA: DUF4097 family beta strand repeat-containing protein [Anaerolineales bacterium]|nr:DUF4097 family beta strand repeat-containing protein [Anaerolineales bacterium]
MRKRILLLILSSLLLCVCILMFTSLFSNRQLLSDLTHLTWQGTSFSSVTAKGEQTATQKVESGTQLRVENEFGNVKVQPASDDSVHLSADISVSAVNASEAEQILSQVRVGWVQDGKQLRTQIDLPNLPSSIFSRAIRVNLTLSVPPEMSGVYSTQFGDVEISGLSGDVEVSNALGNITLAQLQGAVQATSNSGEIHAENLHTSGKVILQSDFGNIQLSDVQAKQVSVECVSGDVGVDGLSGDLQVSNNNGEIQVKDAQVGKLHLTSQNGDITFAGTLDDSQQHLIENANGEISVTLPSDFAIQLDLNTNNGTIESDFAIETLFNGDQSPQENAVKGKINGGASGLLEIQNQNGGITLSAQ